MNKFMTSMLLLSALCLSESGHAAGLASQVKSVYCNFRYSEITYNISSKTIKRLGRTDTTLKPMISLQIDDVNNEIEVVNDIYGSVQTDLLTIVTQPYIAYPNGPSNVGILLNGKDECVGRL